MDDMHFPHPTFPRNTINSLIFPAVYRFTTKKYIDLCRKGQKILKKSWNLFQQKCPGINQKTAAMVREIEKIEDYHRSIQN